MCEKRECYSKCINPKIFDVRDCYRRCNARIVSSFCLERGCINYPEVNESRLSDNCSFGKCLSKKNFLTDTFEFVYQFNKKVKGYNLDFDDLGPG